MATASLQAEERALVQLYQALGSRMLAGSEISAEYLSDDSRIPGKQPTAVVLAESTADIAATLRIADLTGVPVVPRAGGSGRTGGAVPIHGGIVLSTAGMKRVLEFDRQEGLVVVEPGVRLADLHQLVEQDGWFYPPDPNSAELCCLAGNVAENAAGPRAFKYGPTRNYVLGIDTYLPGGTSFFSGARTRKSVTGYDVTSLLVGSEGTLAAFGPITLRLIARPECTLTLAALFPSFEMAMKAVGLIIAARLTPSCLEFLDEKTLQVMRQAGASFPSDAKALLLMDVDGRREDCELTMMSIGDCCTEASALEVLTAESADTRKRLWTARKQMSHAVRARARHKISEDVVVPRTRLVELVQTVVRIGEERRIDALSYGHAGDGNLHVNFLWNDPDEEPQVSEAVSDLFRATIALGGTLSGEHGIGLLKAPYLGLEQGEDHIALEKRIKGAFDPRGIMNPGKIFPATGGAARNPHGNC